MECILINSRIRGQLALLLSLVISPCLFAQSVYKWLDENGEVHYGHNLPPEMVRLEHQRLNSQGIVLEHIEDADIPHILLETELTQNQLAARVQKRLLLATYRTADDIAVVRDRSLEILGKEREVIQRQVAQLREHLADAESLQRQVSDQKGLVYSTLHDTVQSLRESLSRQRTRLSDLSNKQQQVREQYLVEVQRYNEAQALSATDELNIEPVNGSQ